MFFDIERCRKGAGHPDTAEIRMRRFGLCPGQARAHKHNHQQAHYLPPSRDEAALTRRPSGSFTVFASTNLASRASLPDHWLNLGAASENPPGSGQFELIDSEAGNYRLRFYRASSP